VLCNGSACAETFDGSYTILTVSGLKFTYDIAVCQLFCSGETATANEGTAEATENVNGYAAVKLTQSALQ
jgi:hypothetical protein